MSNNSEQQYLDLMQEVLDYGVEKPVYGSDIKIKSLFGRTLRFDLNKGWPLLTTKKVYWKGIIHELLWFLNGDTNIKYLVDNNVHIWNEWAYKNFKNSTNFQNDPITQEMFISYIKSNVNGFAERWGNLNGVYGQQWRSWKSSDGRTIDQIKWAEWKLKNQPDRKHIVISAWNPEFIYEMSNGNAAVLPPCHTTFQFNVQNNKLSCMLFQRSGDYFLGVPYNIASYALLTMMYAKVCGLELGELIMVFGDVHIYSNHFEQCELQITREPLDYPLIQFPVKDSITDYVFSDFNVLNYISHDAIKGDVTVVGGYNEKDKY